MSYKIYRITNKVNQKIYIGFTSKALDQRWGKHLKDSCVGRRTIFCNAIRKYGKDNFFIELVFESENLTEVKNKIESDQIEIHNSHYLKGYGYNMTFGGEGTLGHKHSAETKIKMSKSHLGKLHSDATKNKLSKQRMGKGNPNYGKVFSKQERKRVSDQTKGANNPRAKEFLVITPENVEIIVKDRSGFCKEHNLNYNSVCASIRRGIPYQGYTWTLGNPKLPIE